MANRFRGEVTAGLDGQTYTLRMDMNTMAEFEGETGKNALEWSSHAEAGNVSVRDMIAMVHCAMHRHHPDADRQIAGDILSEDNEVLMRLFEAAAPDQEQSSGNPQKPPRKQ